MYKKLAAILLLWFPFSLAALVSIPLFLWGIISEDESLWRPVGRAMDKLMAAVCGYSGLHTLSAEMGAVEPAPYLRRFLDWVQPGHCVKAARDEGLIK